MTHHRNDSKSLILFTLVVCHKYASVCTPKKHIMSRVKERIRDDQKIIYVKSWTKS